MKVLKFPLIKITFCFILGILFAQMSKPTFLLTLILLLICSSITLIINLLSNKKTVYKSLFGIFCLITSFFIGSFTLVLNNDKLNSSHYLKDLKSVENEYSAEIIIKEKLKNTINNDRYVAKIIELNSHKSYGKIILNIRKDSLMPTLEMGSHLKVAGSFYKNRKPNNPDQFDYGKYLENQQIYAQVYADASKIKIGSQVDRTISYYASKLRNRIIYNLEKNNFNKSELNVVVALILGQQQDISQEIIKDYQYAGAIHVLSVSGLHVGCILLFITFLLKPIPNNKKGSIIKLIIVIASLWMFGILTGLAPSVVRSVTMFSFVAIGMFLRRSVNIYHTLVVSALLILLFQPSFLFDIGFQLSYIALFFIVWLQPLLASIWTPKYKVVNYFWEIITVSFAAQIGTLPLSIYYFHQFPGLFFVTNIVILPMLSLILGIGVVVMILASVNVVWYPMMKLLEYSIWFLNKIIAWVASFEDFIFKDIPLNSYMLWSSYLLIFGLVIYSKKPTFNKLTLSLSALILVQIISIQAKYSSQNKEEFIVFNKKKSTIITERKGDKVTLYSNDSILKTTDDNLVLKSYLVANYCKIEKKKSLSNLYYFKDKKILLMDSSAVYLANEKPDVLVITNSPKVNLERIFKQWKPKQVVVDAANFKSYIKVWKATCSKEKIPFHDTTEKGFYKL
ncbi:competence protein ComEC [Flavobacterium aquatile LMG 4008 = ATCC 11947]|uniref:Competence protein ComEC n=2 Tax=Flavobacterium aquatile TaxID=245 RepID=A0A095UZA5_9FLAO|nr:competence protein ComEC [Flavobacterium aquatile LMG 4008 = ATCC 11947]OXA65400.1 competence protein ComEC [Flavobacterium aquatile LMG 4008 = ATCC 11947]